MGEKFSRRDFLKGMAVVAASGLLVACGGGFPVAIAVSGENALGIVSALLPRQALRRLPSSGGIQRGAGVL